jgi:hypothetical protein
MWLTAIDKVIVDGDSVVASTGRHLGRILEMWTLILILIVRKKSIWTVCCWMRDEEGRGQNCTRGRASLINETTSKRQRNKHELVKLCTGYSALGGQGAS